MRILILTRISGTSTLLTSRIAKSDKPVDPCPEPGTVQFDSINAYLFRCKCSRDHFRISTIQLEESLGGSCRRAVVDFLGTAYSIPNSLQSSLELGPEHSCRQDCRITEEKGFEFMELDVGNEPSIGTKRCYFTKDSVVERLLQEADLVMRCRGQDLGNYGKALAESVKVDQRRTKNGLILL